MYEERSGSMNWGSVVVSLAIIGFTAFALYITHSLWALLGLFFLAAAGNYRNRTQTGASKKCGCGGKKCCGETKSGGKEPDGGSCNGC